MADFLTATGPIFGPDFVVVTVDDEAGTSYQLQVYPDANNEELRKAGRPMQFYWQPARVYLARKHDTPAEYDFGMTVFKGLMTTETTVGVTDDVTTAGTVEAGGGFCTFATTFAVPPSVISAALVKLKEGQHDAPKPWMANLFGRANDAPDPLLGMIPVLENEVTIEVPRLAEAAGASKMPMYIDAQGTGKGSIEAQGISSFLVTLSQLAAGAIVGSIEDGTPPFTVHCDLKEQVYIHGCQVDVTVDVDKSYEQFSGALSAGGFLGITNASLEYAYSKMVTSGAITTKISMDSANLTPELEDWIKKNVEDMRTTAYQILKQEIFDWQPREDPPAEAKRGLISSIFGGASVSLKGSYQKRGVKLTQTLELNSTIAIRNRITGTLNDLVAAMQKDPDTYLAIVDIGEHFKKMQVAAISAVTFDQKVGAQDISDPIKSVSLAVTYPDFGKAQAGQLELTTQAQGFHYKIGAKDPAAAGQLATWSAVNPDNIVNISFLRIDKDLPDWPADQVKLTKTIVFDGQDPRVDFSSGKSTFVVETIGTDHAPKLTADEAGYVFVRFMLDRPIPTENISATLRCTIGSRTDTLTITAENQKDVIWEVFSDKYFGEEKFTYEMEMTVTGGGFTDDPVTWSTAGPVTIPLPEGRLKYVNPLKLPLPPIPADKRELVNSYIAAFPPVG